MEKSALEFSSVSFRQSTFRVSFLGFMQKRRGKKKMDPTKAQCCKLVQQQGKTRSSTFQALILLRAFQQMRRMKNDAPAN